MYYFFLLLPPLQSLKNFNISDYTSSPGKTAFAIIVFTAAAALILYMNLSKKVRDSKVLSSGRINIFESKKPEDIAFLKAIKKYDLKKDEAACLHNVIRASRDTPEEIINNKDALDELFRQAYAELVREADASKEALNDLMTFFKVRNIIAHYEASVEKAGEKNGRSHLRKSNTSACVCELVELVKVKEKGKKVKKLRLTGKKTNGRMIDVSAGGCAVKMDSMVKAGARLKLSFKISKQDISALGDVLRVNTGNNAIICHIKFVKVPPKAWCALNASVFDYI